MSKNESYCPECGKPVKWEFEENIPVYGTSLLFNAITEKIEQMQYGAGASKPVKGVNCRSVEVVRQVDGTPSFIAAMVTCPRCKKEFRATKLI